MRRKFTNQWSVALLGRTASPCDGRLDFEIGWARRLTARTSKTRPQNSLSHVTVSGIKQLGLEIQVVTRSLTKSMSDEFPPCPTLTINPLRIKPAFREGTYGTGENHIPGRSQNERSVRSGPLSSRQTQFFEKLILLPPSGSPSGPVKKTSWLVVGFKIARWARRIRSSTSLFSSMLGPKGMFCAPPIGCPYLSTVFLNTTLHDQGRSEYDRRHSVGHLSPQ